MPAPLPKPPKIKTITLSREIKLTHDYQSAGVHISMTADVNDGSIEETKVLLRKHVDAFIAPRVKECQTFLGL